MHSMVGSVLRVMPSRRMCRVMLIESATHALLVRLLINSNWCDASLTVKTWLVWLVHGVSLWWHKLLHAAHTLHAIGMAWIATKGLWDVRVIHSPRILL